MKHCDKCNITIETKQQYCPLCHQVLSGESNADARETYPDYISPRRMFLPTTKKVILFLTILSIVILIVINWADFDGRYWSLIPIGGIIYFWFLVRVGLFSKRNIGFRFASLTVLLILLLILIDYEGQSQIHGWSIDYMLPLLLMTCNLAISATIWIRLLDYRDYFLYLLVIILFSLAPIILVLTGITTVSWPAIAAFGVAIAILLFIVFFFPKKIKEEIKKRFHA
ncbi:MAG: hypothetical protein JXB08_04350 [Bacilli bacterium]|nr:hypothetical protein [Bacilli bacterium]MBN2876375.1 hypothetical protein [Bacilli bacterium]